MVKAFESNKGIGIGIIKMSRIVALFSFVIGSIILILYYLTENYILFNIGLFYVFFAFVVNSIFLIRLITKLFSNEFDKKQLWISIGIMVLNIPIAILYTFLTMLIIGPIPN